MLEISVEGESHGYKPGERISGRVSLSQANSPEEVSLHLVFYTLGRGTSYSEIIESMSWKSPGSSGSFSFSFRLPLSPYSFSGKLLSICYRLEASADDDEATFDFFVSPSGEEISLTPTNDDEAQDESFSDQQA